MHSLLKEFISKIKPLNLSLDIKTTTVNTGLGNSSFLNLSPISPNLHISLLEDEQTAAPRSTDEDSLFSSAPQSSLTDEPPTNGYPNHTSIQESPIQDLPTSPIHEDHDASESDELATSTACKILRPVASASKLSRLAGAIPGSFSRSSSSLSRPSAMNCFSPMDSFELEIDHMESRRARELAGKADIRVLVTKETTVKQEELWREAVQYILYGKRSFEDLRHRTVTTIVAD